MEARRLIVATLAVVSLALSPVVAGGASARSQNFIVSARTPALAEEICRAAEDYRRDLAIEWLGAELPPWSQPCPIEAQVAQQLGAGGATQFSFSRQGVPFGWSMSVQGSKERVLDSVLPHEVTHTIFATHFGRPLPRWADEGGCTTVEHMSEKSKQEKFLIEFLMTERGIPFNKMFAMKEYPADMLPLYAQGYSLARYLIMQGGKRKYVQYIGEGMQTENWPAVTRKYYGHKDLSDLQVTWLEWVRSGSPRLQPVDGVEARGDVMLAANTAPNANRATATQGSNAERAPAQAIVASPLVTPSGNIPAHALAATTAHTPQPSRAPAYLKNLDSVPPPRPDFHTAVQANPAPASNVQRPYSEGWYARRRDEVKQGGQAAAPQPPLPVQPAAGLAPAPANPPTPATGNAAANSAPPPNRRVMLEWSRPVSEPWNPQPDLSVARGSELTARRDLAADTGGQAWR